MKSQTDTRVVMGEDFQGGGACKSGKPRRAETWKTTVRCDAANFAARYNNIRRKVEETSTA